MLYFFSVLEDRILPASSKEREAYMKHVSIDKNGFIINGKRQILLVGSLFYFRIPRARWRDRMEKMKRAGYHALDVYFPWNHHETAKDTWDFSGERDVSAFLTLAEEVGLYVVARPGPYICSEWDGGGLPAYLFASDMHIRDNDPAFMMHVQKWFDHILPIIKKHSIDQGGCIITMQLENEYDFFSDMLDRHGYISVLKAMALHAGISVPLFCCAGQGGIDASGGLTPGIFPAMNFYPSNSDRHFGQQVLFYQKWLSDQNFPLLVTETNRDHHFLRLLLLLGVKLIGPYNQAGGTDFGFTTAINNWGSPLSFQTSDYDFASLVTPSGEYRKAMALEAKVLRGILDSVPGLCEALPVSLPDGFSPPESVFATALALPDGGLVAGGVQYGCQAEEVLWPEGGYAVSFLPDKCTFIMSHVSLNSAGIDVEITFANAPLYQVNKDSLVFAAEQPQTHIVINGKALSFKNGHTQAVDGITVTLLPWDQAAAMDITEVKGQNIPVAFSVATSTDHDLFASLEPKQMTDGALALEVGGILNGYGLYESKVIFDGVKGLLFADAADVITVTAGDRHLGAFSPEGHCFYLPTIGLEGETHLQVLAEIWGHCNFDDHRTPSLRIKSTKGVKRIATISSVTPLPLWLRTDAVSGAAPQLTALGAWLTTNKPAIGVFYTLQPELGSIRVLHFEGMQAQADVYVNTRFAGHVDRFCPWLDISEMLSDDGILRIECHVTKMDFCEPCGIPILYQGDLLKNVTVKAIGEKELHSALVSVASGHHTLSLPLALGYGQKNVLHGIIPQDDCELTIEGRNIKATILRGGRICGRLVINADTLPAMKGGRPDTAYLPACWGNDVYMYLEPLGDDAALSSIRIRTLSTYMPE